MSVRSVDGEESAAGGKVVYGNGDCLEKDRVSGVSGSEWLHWSGGRCVCGMDKGGESLCCVLGVVNVLTTNEWLDWMTGDWLDWTGDWLDWMTGDWLA